ACWRAGLEWWCGSAPRRPRREPPAAGAPISYAGATQPIPKCAIHEPPAANALGRKVLRPPLWAAPACSQRCSPTAGAGVALDCLLVSPGCCRGCSRSPAAAIAELLWCRQPTTTVTLPRLWPCHSDATPSDRADENAD